MTNIEQTQALEDALDLGKICCPQCGASDPHTLSVLDDGDIWCHDCNVPFQHTLSEL